MPESAKVLTEKIEYNLNYLLRRDPSKGVGKPGELTF